MVLNHLISGEHIGTFGEQSWSLSNTLSYNPLPNELRIDNENFKMMEVLALKAKIDLKRKIVESWKSLVQLEYETDLHQARINASRVISP